MELWTTRELVRLMGGTFGVSSFADAQVAFTVEFSPQDAAVQRLREWVDSIAYEEALALGDRLWMLQAPGNPWFTMDLLPKTRELLPEARVDESEDGPISRPDIAFQALKTSAESTSAADTARRRLVRSAAFASGALVRAV